MTYAPEGNPETATICLIGEAPAKNELILGRPFVGPAGRILDECLHSAGIPRRDCYLTNVFDFEVVKPKQQSQQLFKAGTRELLFTGNSFTPEGIKSVERLHEELNSCRANVFVPMGNPALAALCGKSGILKWRGSILTGKRQAGTIKCMATIHPAATLPGRGKYTWLYNIKHDLRRARRESEFSEVRPVPYQFTYDPPLAVIFDFFRRVKKLKPQIVVDTEAVNHHLFRFSISYEPLQAITVPLDDRWTDAQELAIMLEFASVMEDPGISKIFHNAMFDTWFLLRDYHVHVKGQIDDSMIAHHIMYPDFPKALAFLTSIYTDQPFYKDMVKHTDVEKEDG